MAEDDYANAKTSVWWDIEDCNVPKGVDANTIAQNISSALKKLDYKGPITINAYGDSKLLNNRVQQALHSTGVKLNHIPSGVKDASDKRILVDMLFWAVDNPAPANYLLISGDRDFSNALHQLRLRRYNILLASPAQNVCPPLMEVAKDIWIWANLARGEPAQQNLSSDADQIEKKPNSNFSANGVKVSLPMRHTFSEPDLNYAVSQGLQSAQGVQLYTHNNNKQPIECNFQDASQFQPNWPNHVPFSAAGHLNGQGQSVNSTYFPGTRPMIASENNFPLHSHVSAHGNANTARSSSQYFTNGDYNNYKQDTSELKPPFKPSTKCSTFPGPQGKNFQGSGSPLKSQASPTVAPKPRSTFQHQVTSSISTDNIGAARPAFLPQVKSSISTDNFSAARAALLPQVRSSISTDNFSAARAAFLPQVKSSIPTENFSAARPSFYPQDTSSLSMNNNGATRPILHYQVTSSLSMDNFGSAKSSFPSNPRTPDHQKSYSVQDAQSNSNQMQQQLNLNTNSSGQELPTGRRLPFPEYTSPELLGSSRSQEYVILHAIDFLKQNMMVPTVANIEDCIKYGEMRMFNINIQELLEKLLEKKEIKTLKAAGPFLLYLPWNSQLWNCLDPFIMHDNYSNEAWEKFKNFLLSSEGYKAMMKSEKRYHAAAILKSYCLQNLTLGETTHMLQLSITSKRWIKNHHTGWQPLSILISRSL